MRSRILSIISALGASGLCAGCPHGSAECGAPSDAGELGLAVAGSGIAVDYGELESGANNDCFTADAPAGVVSLTIIGIEASGSGRVTLCIPRPDELANGPQALGSGVEPADFTGVELVDFRGTAGGCTFALDPAQPITGTVAADGLCGEGSAGYALSFDAGVGVTRICGSAADTATLALTGEARVTSQ